MTKYRIRGVDQTEFLLTPGVHNQCGPLRMETFTLLTAGSRLLAAGIVLGRRDPSQPNLIDSIKRIS